MPVLLFSIVVMANPGPGLDCPEGATLAGQAWPQGRSVGCERDGERHGPTVLWHANGTLEAEGTFERGKKSGLWTYGYDNGRRRAMGQLLDGVQDGVWTWWHVNGRLAEEGPYVAGLEHGLWRSWHPNGRTAAEGLWQAGARDGWWTEWDESGRELHRIRYAQDSVVEIRRPTPPAPRVDCRYDPAACGYAPPGVRRVHVQRPRHYGVGYYGPFFGVRIPFYRGYSHYPGWRHGLRRGPGHHGHHRHQRRGHRGPGIRFGVHLR